MHWNAFQIHSNLLFYKVSKEASSIPFWKLVDLLLDGTWGPSIFGVAFEFIKYENCPTLKVSFFLQCSKMQIIPLKKFNIQTCFFQFLWFFRLKCWFKGQIISRIHLSLPNAYKLMYFDRNINGNRDVKFLIVIIGHCTDGRKSLYTLKTSR